MSFSLKVKRKRGILFSIFIKLKIKKICKSRKSFIEQRMVLFERKDKKRKSLFIFGLATIFFIHMFISSKGNTKISLDSLLLSKITEDSNI